MSPFTQMYCIGLYQNAIFAIVHAELVMPINRPLSFLISFYNGYEGAGRAISVHKQVLGIWYGLLVTSEA